MFSEILPMELKIHSASPTTAGPSAAHQLALTQGVHVIFWTPDTWRAQKLARRAIYTTTPTKIEYLDWSDSTITFDRSDHPDYILHPRKFSLVLDPIVGAFHLPKVLMDGGSEIDILFNDTLAKMGISRNRLNPKRLPRFCARTKGGAPGSDIA